MRVGCAARQDRLFGGGFVRRDQIGARRVSCAMPRYFFHVKRGEVTVFDKVGVELADIAEAATEAARRGQEIAARDAAQAGASGVGLIVIDEGWRTVLELPF
jgi:hypothetical protein